MIPRRAIPLCCVLCLALASAIAAPGALASKGTTAFTCKEVGAGKGHFLKEHCRPSDAGSGSYDHVAFAESTKTELSVSNETTGGEKKPLKLKASGPEGTLELQAKTVSGSGWLENKSLGGGEHYVEGELTLALTEVTMLKPVAGCTVRTDEGEAGGAKGAIDFKPLVVTSKELGDSLQFTPATLPTIGNFSLEGCLGNTTWTITGNFKGVPDGATTSFNHLESTERHALDFSGVNAGFEGSLTIRGRANSSQAFTPLSFTTVETP